MRGEFEGNCEGDRKEVPAWQLPPGVCRGAWDYAHLPSIAQQYDSFHDGHPLLHFDQQFIAQQIQEVDQQSSPVGYDLGCGTGRHLIALAQMGWRLGGIDLSESMLEQVRIKAETLGLQEKIKTQLANMVELDSIPDSSADLILCMYSSLGMVRGRKHRQQVLRHAARILKPAGQWIVHVHHRSTWWREPQGWWMQAKQLWRSIGDRQWEFGDRVYPYRGLPNMYLHIYSGRELRQDLQQAGLEIHRWCWLNDRSSGPLEAGWWLPSLRAGGMIVAARRR